MDVRWAWVGALILGACTGAVDGGPGLGSGDAGPSAPEGPQGADMDNDAALPGDGNPTAQVDGSAPSDEDGGTTPVMDSGSDDGGATPDPSPAGWPDATNTGVKPGVVLTASGSITVTQNGQVVENRNVTGGITVKANNVTIRNCRITYGDTAIALQAGYGGLTVEDVTIVGTDKSTNFPPAIVSDSYPGSVSVTVRRVNISGYGMGIRALDGGMDIRDSYLHDLYFTSGNNRQGRDGIEGWGRGHVVIDHNTVELGTTDANCAIKFPCDLPWDGNNHGDVTINNNLVSGGGYAVCAGYCPDQPSKLWHDVAVTNNHFSTAEFPKSGYYGPAAWVDPNLASGNVWHESGKPLSF